MSRRNWFDSVAGGGGSIDYSSASLVLSVQKLVPSYSGDCWLVRRVSDSATQAIGFDGSGLVDESALSSFLGAGQGRLITYHDQKGLNDCTAPTTGLEPLIWDNGFYLRDGKPSIFFEASVRKLVFSSEFEINTANGSFAIMYVDESINEKALLGHTTLNRQFRRQGSNLTFIGSPDDLTAELIANRNHLVCGWEIYRSSSEHRVFDYLADGSLTAYTNTISYKFNQLGVVLTNSIALSGYFTEFIFFDDVTVPDIPVIKSDRINYFGL